MKEDIVKRVLKRVTMTNTKIYRSPHRQGSLEFFLTPRQTLSNLFRFSFAAEERKQRRKRGRRSVLDREYKI